MGFLGSASGKEPSCQCRRCKRCGFDPWVRKIPWRRKWQPAPVFLPGKSHGQRSLVLRYFYRLSLQGFPGGGSDKESTCQCRRHKRCGFNHWIIWSLGCEDPLEEEMATYSSFLAWRIPWTDKPARPQSIGLQSVRHERRNLTHKVFSLGQT